MVGGLTTFILNGGGALPSLGFLEFVSGSLARKRITIAARIAKQPVPKDLVDRSPPCQWAQNMAPCSLVENAGLRSEDVKEAGDHRNVHSTESLAVEPALPWHPRLGPEWSIGL